MSALSDFYEPLRVILQDNDPLGYENTDENLAAALRTAWMMGLWPGYTLAGTAITPDLLPGKTFAVMLMETVILMTIGGDGAHSFKTRALSVTDHGDRKRDILFHARQKIYELRDGDAVFSTRQSLIAFLNTITDIGDLADVTVTPPLSLTFDYSNPPVI